MSKRVFTQVFAVVGVIIEKEGKILLVREGDHAKADVGTWNQPAGWIELGEDPLEAVKKEVKEETGLDFKPTGLVGIYSIFQKHLEEEHGLLKHAVKLIFRGESQGELMEANEEISELRWFDPEEIRSMKIGELRDLDIKHEIEDYFAGVSYPLEIIHHSVQQR